MAPAPKAFPYLTAWEWEKEATLMYRPRYRRPERTTSPANREEAEAIAAQPARQQPS